jgi:YegS/Rv2252/BmrU family lipid kinase
LAAADFRIAGATAGLENLTAEAAIGLEAGPTRHRYNNGIKPHQQPVLIYNPIAGGLRRDPGRIIQRTIEALGKAGWAPRVLATHGAGEATDLARKAVAGGAGLILVLGGDGTINEAANGIAGSNVPLGVLPGGTANVLAMELGLGSNLERAIQRLGESVERRVALGRLCYASGDQRYFLMMGGVGLDANVVYSVDPSLKRMAGKFAYWVAGLSKITSRVAEFEARVNGSVYRCGFALASRVRNYGGDLEIARGASLLKEEFEVVLFEGSNPLRYAWYLLGVLMKQVQSMRGVHTFHMRHVEFSGGAHLHIDGEYAGMLPARFEIVPDALTLLAPNSYR